MEEHVRAFADALIESGKNYITIYPNNDAGSSMILREYERIRESRRVRLYPSIRFEHFLTLLKNARFIIGNSSAGVREAPFYGIPSINVGTRQSRRYLGPTVINANYTREDITGAIETALGPDHVREPSTHFGDGKSRDRFARSICSGELWKTPLQKEFFDR